MDKFCSSCGAKLEEGSSFCTVCGAALKKEAPPVEKLNNKWLWIEAFVPLFAIIVQAFFEVVFEESMGVTENTYAIAGTVSAVITVLMSIIFIGCDNKEIAGKGYDLGGWLWWAIALPVGWLFFRANKTDKKYAPGVIWCVLFVIYILTVI